MTIECEWCPRSTQVTETSVDGEDVWDVLVRDARILEVAPWRVLKEDTGDGPQYYFACSFECAMKFSRFRKLFGEFQCQMTSIRNNIFAEVRATNPGAYYWSIIEDNPELRTRYNDAPYKEAKEYMESKYGPDWAEALKRPRYPGQDLVGDRHV